MADVPRRNEEVKKKPICIFHYNMFMKGVDRADKGIIRTKRKTGMKEPI